MKGRGRRAGTNILFVCKQFDISHIAAGHFIGFEPLVAPAGGEDVVHHMNIFRCDDTIGMATTTSFLVHFNFYRQHTRQTVYVHV